MAKRKNAASNGATIGYHDFVRPIRQELYAGQNHTLAALRDTILPKLISGELRVKDATRFRGRCA